MLTWTAAVFGQTNTVPADVDAAQAITRLRECLVDSFNRGDIDRLLAYLDTNAVVTWQNGEVCEGTAAVKAYYERMMKGDKPVVRKITSDPKINGRQPSAPPASRSFAQRHALYIAAFNHLTPFPGTPLYQRLQAEGRLLYEAWWLDERYSYNKIPFRPHGMSVETLQRNCLAARRAFYSWPSILRRSCDQVNRSGWFMWRNFYVINGLHRNDVSLRDHYPPGDESWQGPLLQAN
jgi:hypothetical protein